MENSKEQITKIRSLLGVDSSKKWIEFMDYIYYVLSDVLTVGKPSLSAIENSIIGEFGFKSWREMFTAPQEKNGFGGNYSTYNAWKRAYSVILKNPYLRGLELTASQINTINRENKDSFPSSLEAYEQLLSERDNKLKESHANSVKASKNRILELENEVLSTKSQLNDDLNHLTIEKERLSALLEQEKRNSSDSLDKLLEMTQQNEVLRSHFKAQKKISDDQESKIKLLNRDLRKSRTFENRVKGMNYIDRLFFLFKKEI